MIHLRQILSSSYAHKKLKKLPAIHRLYLSRWYVRIWHSLSFQCAKHYPIMIHIAKRCSCDPRRSVVKIFVNIHIEKRIQVDKVFVGVNCQKSFDYCWVLQPFFNFWRSNGIVDDALQGKLSFYDKSIQFDLIRRHSVHKFNAHTTCHLDTYLNIIVDQNFSEIKNLKYGLS